jgi:hypothetical protein
MAPLSSAGSSASRPLVIALFAASCLLSLVSWYTTEQGMALYLSPWFAVLASLGIQTALVMVAWLIGFSKAKRGLLIAVYAITAVVSISFSYVSLYTWFSARERPATIERGLYDRLSTAATQTGETLQAAIGEGKRHVLALQEMTDAEKAHGYISRAQDADPYLASIREAVAKEAQSYSSGYKEGSGLGLRYTAFDRYEKLTRESLAQIEQAQGAMAAFRTTTRPTDPSDKQLKSFREAYDQIPWAEVEKTIHGGKLARPELPSYADNVDKTASQQEDLMVAFTELFTNPGGRHIFSLALAAFIDIVVFLLAYSSGPYFFGAPEQRWCEAGAALDAAQSPIFVRSFLNKLRPGRQGMPRVDSEDLTSGEQQLCMMLVSKGMAATVEESGKSYYLLDSATHESLLDTMASGNFTLKATPRSDPA